MRPLNMLFLEPEELGAPLGRDDERVRHVVKVLKKREGDELAAGMPDGALGRARIEAYDGRTMTFSFNRETESAPLRPITMLVGLPRPIQANRILKDLCSLGIARILLVATELGERSYLDSGFYSAGEYRSALIEGAQQAGNPRLPDVGLHGSIAEALKVLGSPSTSDARWALDPYRGSTPFGAACIEASRNAAPADRGMTLAVGSERGWTPAELDRLEAAGFGMAALGDRILKSETAATVAVSLSLAALGYL